MALPRVNEVLKFNLTIPSTNQTIRYRPYLVKEEKVLLQAFESQDAQACISALCDTLESCVEGEVDVRSLATFDLEYMFLKVRSKSVGETSDVIIQCKEESCRHKNDISIDLDKVEVSSIVEQNIIDITDTIKVEMAYPNYDAIMNSDLESENIDTIIGIVAGCIVAVHTDEERIDVSSLGKGELTEFLDSMTASQLKKIAAYVEDMPALTHDIAFKCQKCGVDNELTLKGLSDFF